MTALQQSNDATIDSAVMQILTGLCSSAIQNVYFVLEQLHAIQTRKCQDGCPPFDRRPEMPSDKSVCHLDRVFVCSKISLVSHIYFIFGRFVKGSLE